MPILLPARDEDPLLQGDLLDDIGTIVAVPDADPTFVEGMVLVVSRPCVAVRSAEVVVARVRHRVLQDLRNAESLDDMRDYFLTLRNGDGAPDSFYLGELEVGSHHRYFAKFDALFTVQIPPDEAGRRSFLQKHRRFSLAPDFVRDLQLRLFHSFADLGFDDSRWWSDEDLKLVVGKGAADIARIDAALQEKRNRIGVLQTAGGGKEERGVTKEIEDLEKQRVALRKTLAPLQAELLRRDPSGS